jgi:unsaturated rhamnogalacturonyl hydrolase
MMEMTDIAGIPRIRSIRQRLKRDRPMKAGAWRLGVFGGLFSLAGGILLSVYARSAVLPSIPSGDKIQDTLKLVADWQLDHIANIPTLDSEETGWVQASFYIGLARWAARSDDPRYFEAIRKLGQRNEWHLGRRLYHADDHAIGQVYAAAFDHYGDLRMIAPMVGQFDRILANKPNVTLTFDQTDLCQQRWCWCDALFMAPASWMAASRITGDRRYRDFADTEFWTTKDYLFDPDEHLFFRDSRFFDARGPHDEKIFWGRGNGWVFAGLINILRELPRDHPSRVRYEALFIQMADKLLTRQRLDGFWATSLMSPLESSTADSSGTAFFTYGMASGVNLGLLNRERFETAALRGWNALAGTVDPYGRLGQVQQIRDRPAPVDINDTQLYGSGGLLLAGTATMSMIEAEQNHR